MTRSVNPNAGWIFKLSLEGNPLCYKSRHTPATPEAAKPFLKHWVWAATSVIILTLLSHR